MQEFLKKPSTDFGAVRDGRQALPFYIDIDLTTARSIAAGTALVVPIAGNSFFTDADTTNGGNATVHFQDIALGNSSAPFFVSPGFIANVGFTQLLIENTAQAGKRMRIFYGVDIDFQAGVNASIAITGAVSITGRVKPDEEAYTLNHSSISQLAANTPVTVVAPGTNVNGVRVKCAQIGAFSGSLGQVSFIAKSGAAPTTVIDGDVLLMVQEGNSYQDRSLQREIFVPAGKGLYFISSVLESAGSWRNATVMVL